MPHPSTSYEEALAKFATLEQEEAALPLSQAGHSRLFVHGAKTERAFVLLHGLSSCPEQDVVLGKMLFDLGANVIIPRAKYAGFSDLLNAEQGKQNGQDLLDQAATGLDIAAGLGNKTTIIAISASALAAAWMAQHRPGIESVLLISPFFAPYGYSALRANILANLLVHLPNIFLWKDSHRKAAVNDNSYNYPRWSTHTLASTLQLARNVAAFREPIECNRLSILVSDDDETVNNHLTKKILKRWKRENPDKIFFYAFPKSLQVPHNCLNQEQKDFSLETVYAQILKMVQ
ncbi:MAG: hypothetical protein K2W99_05930 [Chthoniobacterales bacterium]|nr:hypothetical protein [Chthoniobacterales bacterium]